MQDFIRIGGDIISSPLNENFRRLLNDISIVNTNLIFPEENGVVVTLTDMLAIESPEHGQVCYVISSGELYRYTKGTTEWIKIADFGQTFRQGFLNSGAVVLEDYITLVEGSKTTLSIPQMLVYFKNQPGDGRYLGGMYLHTAQELDMTSLTNGSNAYSILCDYQGNLSVIPGMPSEDDVNLVYLGTVLINSSGEILEDFIYTIPDIAYTADRGNFYMNGGESSGCYLTCGTSNDTKVNRQDGYYYDEGVNFAIGSTADFPIDTDNGSNYNLKYYEGKDPVETLYYMTPTDSLKNSLVESDGLIINQYWAGERLETVEEGLFTIQHHLLTPNGQDIMIYGTQTFPTMMDAVSNLNVVESLSINFPYIETCRVIACNSTSFDSSNTDLCQFFTLDTLGQVGTVSPEFADNVFTIYSGDDSDTNPALIQFSLSELQKNEYAGLFLLPILSDQVTRDLFYSTQKYITDSETETVESTSDMTRLADSNIGYFLADNEDINYLKERVADIEKEIWATYGADLERYNQSVRYRLFNAETRLDEHDENLEEIEGRLDWVEANKVNKGTLVNGYTLGDTDSMTEIKSFDLATGDIDEGNGLTSSTNLWYTEARVSANTDVVNATTHINTISASDNASSHTVVNPHNISTDDVKLLTDTNRLFVTQTQSARIAADKLPDDTISELTHLDEVKIESVGIYTTDGKGSAPEGNKTKYADIKHINFYKNGVGLSLEDEGDTLLVDVIGQADGETFMLVDQFATASKLEPDFYENYVDNAIHAEYAERLAGMESVTANQYYGSDDDSILGFYDIATWVSTADASGFTTLDDVVFTPIDGTVTLDSLEETLADTITNNYHTVYNNGVLVSSEVNTFSFGDNLTTTLEGNTITITGAEAGSAGVNNLVNLGDVDITYTDNAGKVLVVNQNENGVVLNDMPNISDYMTRTIYVSDTDISKVKYAEVADMALNATTATEATTIGGASLYDEGTSVTSIWSAARIIEYVGDQIESETVETFYGTEVPADSLGKEGDIYILIEE